MVRIAGNHRLGGTHEIRTEWELGDKKVRREGRKSEPGGYDTY